MNVVFAPDNRDAFAYQELRANPLRGQGVVVNFMSGQRRVMPLWRTLRSYCAYLLHLHYPEWYYYSRKGDGADLFRRVRYRLDLALAIRDLPLVLTANDLFPHNHASEVLLKENYQYTLDRALAVFVHTAGTLDLFCETYRMNRDKCHLIPCGDLSVGLGQLPTKVGARTRLGVSPGERICLMFGKVEPYKGIEPVIRWWRTNSPAAKLVIVGEALSADYEACITRLADSAPNVLLRLAWQSKEDHKAWLAAADCMVFHYREIAQSGAACEARSIGLPILVPRRLRTVDLMEPHRLVFRFESLDTDFRDRLADALSVQPSYESAREWREATAWELIARETAQVYRKCIRANSC
jgi:hypothetical protein